MQVLVSWLGSLAIDLKRWRKRFGLRQVYAEICKEWNDEYIKTTNKSTNMQVMVSRLSSRCFYLREQSTTASKGEREQYYS